MNEYIGKSKKRIAINEPTPSILILSGGMGVGGKERQIIELLKGIKRNNRLRTILAVGHINGAREAEAAKWADQVWMVKRLSRYDLITPLIDLLQHSKKDKIDVIHTWGGGIWDLYGWAVARILHISFIHGGIRAAPLFLDLANKISRWAASHADVIIANSHAGLNSFGFQNHPRARVIYNGVDLSRFIGIETSSEIHSTVCMVANFSDKKDHETPIHALPLIMRFFPDIRLVFVGHDAGTLASTRKLVNELGLSQAVQFVTNTLNPEPIVAGSQVCILSSFTEAISNSILEYMGMHKPVVATANCGNAEVVESGITGFLIPPNSPEILAEHIIILLRNPDLAKSMGEAGYHRLFEIFSLERMVNSYEDQYSSLLEK
jgi:glycosyltransferase involved in cell wall biosynthesis